MKIKFLGTAAAEAFPAAFCNCEYCSKARELKGKNIRTRHQTLINDDLLIDFPADTYCHVINYGLRLDYIKYLLITHTHYDHFYTAGLQSKVEPYAHNQRSKTLTMYGGEGAKKIFESKYSDFDLSDFNNIVKFNYIDCFKPVNIGDGYVITSLPARHDFGNDGRFFIIEQNGKRILYAHDTGLFYEEVFKYIEDNKLFFDFITLDCTNVSFEWPDEDSHMGFCQIVKVLNRLEMMGAISAKTIKYVNHFSHNANALQDYIESIAKKYDLHVAFDGEEITF